MQPAIIEAFTTQTFAALRAAVVGELVPIIADNVDPHTWDPRELGPSGGNVFQAVVWQDRIWYRDDTSTAPHDGVTCIVLLDGGHYLTNDVEMPRSVLSRSVTDPPLPGDSPPPTFGEAWLVPAAATGDWATHEGDVALWTARGWRYRPPARGDLLFIQDEAGYLHYSAADLWIDGIGSYAFAVGSIQPQNLLIRDWNVENQTTNAPPAAGPAGEQYVIGPLPSGAWAGQAKKIAFRPALNAAFVILAPFTGEEVYDKSQNIRFRWTGATWESTAGAIVEYGSIFSGATPAIAAETGGTNCYDFSATVAPTTAQSRSVDTLATFNVKSRRSNQKLRFRWSASVLQMLSIGDLTNSDDGDLIVAIWRDNEVSALDWVKLEQGLSALANEQQNVRAEFEITTDDALAHDYKIAVMSYRSNADNVRYKLAGGVLNRRRFTYEMFS
jgi:hypothetical protein